MTEENIEADWRLCRQPRCWENSIWFARLNTISRLEIDLIITAGCCILAPIHTQLIELSTTFREILLLLLVESSALKLKHLY